MVGCDTQLEPEDEVAKECLMQPIPGVLQPLEVGNYWLLDLWDEFGEIARSDRHEITGSFISREDDSKVYFVKERNPPSDVKEILINTEVGLHSAGLIVGSDTVMAELVTWPYPSEVGEPFIKRLVMDDGNGGNIIGDFEFPYEVVSTGFSTVTSVKTYQTYVYEARSTTHPAFDHPLVEEFYHFAPGIGLVATNYRALTSDFPSSNWPTFRLREYCLMQ